MEDKNYVFISYSSKDMIFAEQVCVFLEANGIPCWIAPRNIEAGVDFPSQIVSAIKNCVMLVLLASENTNASGHVCSEVGIAFDNNKIIIPFKLQKFNFTDNFLYFLGRKHWIEAHEGFEPAKIVLKDTILSLTDVFNVVTHSKPEKNDKGNEDLLISEDRCDEKDNDYSREAIVKYLIEQTKKYPYNIYSKVSTDAKYASFLKSANVLFKETITMYYHNKIVDFEDTLIDGLALDLSKEDGVTVQVKGLPGSAKNMLLQLVLYKMYDYFLKGKTNALPFYISASYYEKLPYEPKNVAEQMKKIMGEEMKEYFKYLKKNPQVKPVLFIEAIREHNVARVSPENAVNELWRPFGRFNRICAIDVGLIKNRSRLKRVIPLAGDSGGYTLLTKQVLIEDKVSAIKVIESVFNMYDYDLDARETYELLKKMKFVSVDIFLVRLIAREILSFGQDEIRLADMYERLALSELDNDYDKLKNVSEELFDYVFDQTYAINSSEYNASMWSLPHKHNTYLEFLLAYYFVYRINNYREYNEHRFFATMLTGVANRFVVSLLRDDYQLQNTMQSFIFENYEVFNVRQKSNSLYWLGRITYDNLAIEAVAMLSKEFTKYKPLVKTNNKNNQENCNNHFLFRAVCTGLMFQGQANIMDEYLCIVVTNDIANAINRGATIEYYGDNYQMVAHDAYYFDTDLSTGEQAIRTLCGRIEATLEGNTAKFVETNLVTLLTLLQARIQNVKNDLRFDIKPYVMKALNYLEKYQMLPQNIVSRKILYYFKSVEEDMKLYIANGAFDIGPLIYNKYRALRDVKRFQWVDFGIDDPESVSEHSYSAWMMAMFFLPEEHHSEGYNKKEILDMLLVHDMAEAVLGDPRISLREDTKDLKDQNDTLKKLFLKGTYPYIANLAYYYNVWTGYYNGVNTNARTARDINLLQSIYTFCEYYCANPEKFTKEDVNRWLKEKSNLKTELGYQLYDRLITNNHEFVLALGLLE